MKIENCINCNNLLIYKKDPTSAVLSYGECENCDCDTLYESFNDNYMIHIYFNNICYSCFYTETLFIIITNWYGKKVQNFYSKEYINLLSYDDIMSIIGMVVFK